MEFFTVDVEETIHPAFKDMDESSQYWMLRDAYDEKTFRECPGHTWELSIEYGNLDISCIRCTSSYSEVSPEYKDDLVFRTTLYSLGWKMEKNAFTGEVNDQYLEAI